MRYPTEASTARHPDPRTRRLRRRSSTSAPAEVGASPSTAGSPSSPASPRSPRRRRRRAARPTVPPAPAPTASRRPTGSGPRATTAPSSVVRSYGGIARRPCRSAPNSTSPSTSRSSCTQRQTRSTTVQLDRLPSPTPDHRSRGCGPHAAAAQATFAGRRPRLPQQHVEPAAPAQQRQQPVSPRTARPRRNAATSRSPRSTCSTTSSTRRRTGTDRRRRVGTSRTCTYNTDRGATPTAHACTWATCATPRPRPCPHRPPWRRHRGQPAAPGGQGGRGDQHDGRRRDQPRGGREPDQDRLLRPRRRAPAPRRRAQRATGPPTTLARTPRSATAGPTSPARVRRPSRPSRAGRHPQRLHLQPAHHRDGRALADPGELAGLPQRPRAARAGLPAGRRHPRRRLHRHRQPLQVQGRARRREHRPGTTTSTPGDGAGSYNGDRIRQAKALADFADSVVGRHGHPRGLHDR